MAIRQGHNKAMFFGDILTIFLFDLTPATADSVRKNINIIVGRK